MATVSAHKSTDPLTGLPDYAAFLRRLRKTVTGSKKAPQPVTAALIDLDFFGNANESLGRDTGERIIAALGAFLAARAGADATVYRYGGDAFMALLEGVEKEQGFLRMESLREEFARGEVLKGVIEPTSTPLTFSVGVAAFPDDAPTDVLLVRKCTEALYRAKVSGRDKVCLAREEKMVTKTTHYTQGQLEGLSRLAKREGMNEAALLREAIDDLLRKYNS